MTKITSIFGYDANKRIAEAVADGLITERSHPEFPELRILNYTPKAAYEGKWNDVTLTSRGLIYNAKTNEVIARPFRKFFNYGQAEAPAIANGARMYWVGDKFDGSLGIGYIRPDGLLAVATRGSFVSEQADHATTWLWGHQDVCKDFFEAIHEHGHTPLVEIIYPENRIVLDYEQQDYLEPLGWVDISTGAYRPPSEFRYVHTFREVLSWPDRPNSEGWVIWLDPHTAVKVKQEDYIALHKVVTGLNEKSVWAAISAGYPNFIEFVAKLPDELQPWAEKVGSDLAHHYGGIVRDIDALYQNVVELEYQYRVAWDAEFDRARFARLVQVHVPAEYRGFVFAALDGKDYQGKVWKLIEPKGVGSRPGAVTRALEDA